jgi:phospholipid-binding lipoprotein MlaA
MITSRQWAGLRAIALLLAAVTLSGCATLSEKDPYEQYNRTVFAFNDAVDTHALKPAATVYKKAVPSVVQTGVNNFFGNLSDLWSSANNVMQGKGERGLSDFTRVIINSTFGLGGVIDFASDAGLEKHSEDFGQTLGYWGVPAGPYVMLPLLGPSTLRDTVALPADIAADPWGYHMSVGVRNTGTVLRVIDQRAALLDATNLLEGAALNRYEFIRDGYLQRRKGQVFDGEGSRQEAKDARNDDAAPDAQSIRAAYADDETMAPPADPAKAADAPATSPASKDAPKETLPAVSSETPTK